MRSGKLWILSSLKVANEQFARTDVFFLVLFLSFGAADLHECRRWTFAAGGCRHLLGTKQPAGAPAGGAHEGRKQAATVLLRAKMAAQSAYRRLRREGLPLPTVPQIADRGNHTQRWIMIKHVRRY